VHLLCEIFYLFESLGSLSRRDLRRMLIHWYAAAIALWPSVYFLW